MFFQTEETRARSGLLSKPVCLSSDFTGCAQKDVEGNGANSTTGRHRVNAIMFGRSKVSWHLTVYVLKEEVALRVRTISCCPKIPRGARPTGKVNMKLTIVAVLALTPLLAKNNEPVNRLDEAAAVVSEVMAAPDKGIPQELLENAHCIVIVPDLKTAAFVFGGKYGKGYVSCRKKDGMGWSAPGTVRIEGGSVGFQIGGSSTDLIMLAMNERGAEKLLSSKFTLGVEGSVAAGPVGRTATAQTDAQMHADILSWSRSQGLFAGLALEGATLRQDLDDNASYTARNWRTGYRDERRAGSRGGRQTDRSTQPVLTP
jgi:lipid-binding SYLF domain-containing protein